MPGSAKPPPRCSRGPGPPAGCARLGRGSSGRSCPGRRPTGRPPGARARPAGHGRDASRRTGLRVGAPRRRGARSAGRCLDGRPRPGPQTDRAGASTGGSDGAPAGGGRVVVVRAGRAARSTPVLPVRAEPAPPRRPRGHARSVVRRRVEWRPGPGTTRRRPGGSSPGVPAPARRWARRGARRGSRGRRARRMRLLGSSPARGSPVRGSPVRGGEQHPSDPVPRGASAEATGRRRRDRPGRLGQPVVRGRPAPPVRGRSQGARPRPCRPREGFACLGWTPQGSPPPETACRAVARRAPRPCSDRRLDPAGRGRARSAERAPDPRVLPPRRPRVPAPARSTPER